MAEVNYLHLYISRSNIASEQNHMSFLGTRILHNETSN